MPYRYTGVGIMCFQGSGSKIGFQDTVHGTRQKPYPPFDEMEAQPFHLLGCTKAETVDN